MGLRVVALMILVSSLGCGREREDKWTRARPAVHRTRGRVEMAGEPVAGAKVVFHIRLTDTGREYSAFGYTDSGGRFSLQTFRDGDGAVAGDHAVTVEKITFSESPPQNEGDVTPPPQETNHLPERYRSVKTSGLSATVEPGGKNMFIFTIDDE